MTSNRVLTFVRPVTLPLSARIPATNARARFRTPPHVHWQFCLESHPRHARARKLFAGFGGVLSFELSGPAEQADELIAKVTLPAVERLPRASAAFAI